MSSSFSTNWIEISETKRKERYDANLYVTHDDFLHFCCRLETILNSFIVFKAVVFCVDELEQVLINKAERVSGGAYLDRVDEVARGLGGVDDAG